MAQNHEVPHPPIAMTQITYAISTMEPTKLRAAVDALVEHYGDSHHQMYFTINGFYQTDAYQATAAMIGHLMEHYCQLMQYRGLVITQVSLTILRTDAVVQHTDA